MSSGSSGPVFSIPGTLLCASRPSIAVCLQILEIAETTPEGAWRMVLSLCNPHCSPGRDNTSWCIIDHRNDRGINGGHCGEVSFPRSASAPHAGAPRGQHGKGTEEQVRIWIPLFFAEGHEAPAAQPQTGHVYTVHVF